VCVRYPCSQLCSSHKSHPSLCYLLLPTTKTAHYAKECPIVSIKVSLSSRLILPSGFVRILDAAAGIFLAHRETLKLSLSNLCGSLKRFLFECLISAGFHSSHARLLTRIEIECLGYLFAFATTLVSRPFSHSHEIYP